MLHKQRERAREISDDCEVDGLHMRPFCSREFVGGGIPTYDAVERAWVYVNEDTGAMRRPEGCDLSEDTWAELERDLW